MLRKYPLLVVLLALALMPALAQAQSPGKGKGHSRQLAAATRSQMMALEGRSRTNYPERHTTSVAYLHWVAKLWNSRRQAAKVRVREILTQRGYLPPARARVLGSVLAARFYGWSGEQWRCLDTLWGKSKYGTLESGWDVLADNPGSDAGGIPQALPASKMSSAGADWLRSAYTQIKWGLRYIKTNTHFHTPCEALNFRLANHWY
jgi:hypothetical protein